jgi:hypothetical protein
MKAALVLSRLDDLLNPIAVKELRQAVNGRAVVSMLTLFLLLQLSILLLVLSLGERSAAEPVSLDAGRTVFEILQGILLGACMLLVPLYAGVRLAAERSDSNVDLLFISALRPRDIIAGKLQASIVLILLIFSACAPFMTFTYLLRGLDIPSIVLVLGLDFLIVLLCAQGAILFGTMSVNAILKALLGLAGLGLLVFLFSSTMTLSISLLQAGLGSRLDSLDFWLAAGAVVGALVALIGLMFIWSVAIVSPPSANRMLPVRLYVLSCWLVSGGGVALLAHYYRMPALLYGWEWAFVALLSVQLLIAINEREQWGLRIRRTLPRRWWLRGPLFLLYSGSAGGILFTVLLLVLTIALPTLALEYRGDLFSSSSSHYFSDFDYGNLLTLVLIALYTFDYAMLAVGLRNVVLRSQIPGPYTWVLALLLVALGALLPWPLLFLFQNEALRQGLINPWWQISNPFATIYTCVVESDGDKAIYRDMCLLFLGGLGLLLLLGCLPWMARQVRRFRPPEKETRTRESGRSQANGAA